jgi:quercetin dioxygenase-like cupin family protein
MDEEKLARDLKQEGFRHTYVWQDAPNASYPDHTHATETAHLILRGEMTVTVAG